MPHTNDDWPLLLPLLPAGIRPEEIDILVTNCSIYCPTPSLASMLVNKFKLRKDVQSYHLGGMGCGNGVMALGLIKDLLQVCMQCAWTYHIWETLLRTMLEAATRDSALGLVGKCAGDCAGGYVGSCYW
jgi:3-ketoacyl-CoA synthase